MKASIEIVGTGPTFDKVVEHLLEHAHEWRDEFAFEISSIAVRDLSKQGARSTRSGADFTIHVREPNPDGSSKPRAAGQ